MRRFEFKDGKSNKFWEIEVRGSTFVTRHGRIGTEGKETIKHFGSQNYAMAQAESAIKSKTKKGYVEVDAEAIAAEAVAAAMPQDDSPQASLERKLIADPQAWDDWLVYADNLTQAGDPRGELVSIGVAWARHQAEGKKKDKKIDALLDREDKLLQDNAATWFGKLVEDDTWRECFAWSLETGFWKEIRLWLDYDHKDADLPKALAYALDHPSCKFLRRLTLGLVGAEGDCDYEPCVRAMLKHGPLLSLRNLYIGDFVRDETEISWVHVSSVGRLWALYPNLESMTLRGGGIDLGNPKSTSLRSLTLNTGGLPGPAGESLGRAELPNLTRLEVWFGTTNYGGSCNGGHARGILTNKHLAKLEHLALANADFANDIATEVSRNDLPPKLRTLDLSMGTMTDTGAKRLLAASDKLSKLDRIDLDSNFLSPAMCTRLKKELGNVSVARQKTSDGDWYYVSVGE